MDRARPPPLPRAGPLRARGPRPPLHRDGVRGPRRARHQRPPGVPRPRPPRPRSGPALGDPGLPRPRARVRARDPLPPRHQAPEPPDRRRRGGARHRLRHRGPRGPRRDRRRPPRLGDPGRGPDGGGRRVRDPDPHAARAVRGRGGLRRAQRRLFPGRRALPDGLPRGAAVPARGRSRARRGTTRVLRAAPHARAGGAPAARLPAVADRRALPAQGEGAALPRGGCPSRRPRGPAPRDGGRDRDACPPWRRPRRWSSSSRG